MQYMVRDNEKEVIYLNFVLTPKVNLQVENNIPYKFPLLLLRLYLLFWSNDQPTYGTLKRYYFDTQGFIIKCLNNYPEFA